MHYHYKKQSPWATVITIYDQCYNALVTTVAIRGICERKTSGTSLRISSMTALLKSHFPNYLLKIFPSDIYTGWKVSKYGVISGPYFPVFGLNTGKYGPEITPYLDTFHVVIKW